MKTVATGVSGSADSPVELDIFPANYCPVCSHSINATAVGLIAAATLPGSFAQHVEVPFRCPRRECGSVFVARYFCNPNVGRFELKQLVPKSPPRAAIDETVRKISPSFVKIFEQALAAEASGLDQIAGVGFRKALEFLIKDYCISKDKTKEDQIKKTALGNCIKTLVTDPNIKACAERATWIGNDETHYVRSWSDHDITDLKRLIKLTENWITNEILTAEYMATMQKPTP